MVQCVVIADDLTGANATGAMLRKIHLKTITLMNLERIELKSLSDYDVIAYPTDSRAKEKEVAYNRVYNVAKLLYSPEVKLYNKRIDSTLRGNLGAEIDAILDGLGDNRIAIVVPGFPQAGRTAVGGYLLVNGAMLERTDAAQDPKNPISTSVIEKLVLAQTKYKAASIYLDTVYAGEDAVKDKIIQAAKEGNRIIIIDALQIEDLEVISDAVTKSGLSFVTVDPGPFTATVAGKLIIRYKNAAEEKILLSVGSVTGLTKLQLEETGRAYNLCRVEMRVAKIIEGEGQREGEIQRVVNEVAANTDLYDLFCVVTDSVHPENRLDFKKISADLKVSEENLSLMINDAVAEATHRILRSSPLFRGVFSSGGDITVAICRRFNASGMELLQEVFPLVAYGTLDGGDFPGLKIVTKGGMVGGPDGIKKCVQFLKEQMNADSGA